MEMFLHECPQAQWWPLALMVDSALTPMSFTKSSKQTARKHCSTDAAYCWGYQANISLVTQGPGKEQEVLEQDHYGRHSPTMTAGVGLFFGVFDVAG